MAKVVYLTVPLSEEAICSLKLDDVVYLSGTVYSFLYREPHINLREKIKAGIPASIDLKDGVAYYTGAIYTQNENGSYNILSIGSTTSTTSRRS